MLSTYSWPMSVRWRLGFKKPLVFDPANLTPPLLVFDTATSIPWASSQFASLRNFSLQHCVSPVLSLLRCLISLKLHFLNSSSTAAIICQPKQPPAPSFSDSELLPDNVSPTQLHKRVWVLRHFPQLPLYRTRPKFHGLTRNRLEHIQTPQRFKLCPSHHDRLGLGFLITLIMFPCKYCAERFVALSARGLTQHHRKCQAFLKHEAEVNQRRKTTVASNKIRRTKLRARVKLGDRKSHLGSAALGVSFFLIIDKYHD
jgi:hypothetical protein